MNSSEIESFIEVACSRHCASFDRDHAAQFDSARQMLEDQPELANGNLASAAITGNVDCVNALLDAQPDLATATLAPRNWTALLYLCFSRFLRGSDEARISAILECARLLLAAGADPNAFFMLGDERETALYAACGVVNNAKLAKLLIDAGAEVNDGDASYHVAEFESYDCVRVLFESGMDKDHRATVLLRKLDFEDPVGVRTILEMGADPNGQGIWGKSPLHQAIMRRRSLGVIKMLLDFGADVNATRKDGASVYYLAARFGRPDVVKLLEGNAVVLPRLSPSQQLVAACGLANEAAAQKLVDENPRLIASLDADQRRAICDCGKGGHVDAIRVMLSVGWDIAQSDNQGFTALHWAAWYGHLECVEFLLSHNAPVDIKNNYGGEVLDSAVWGYANSDGDDRNCREILTRLVAAGASFENVSPFPTGHDQSDVVLAELGR